MSLYPRTLSQLVSLQGIPVGPNSNIYLVDPVSGSDNNHGQTFNAPLASVEDAYDRCVRDQHDTVILLSGDTANALSASMSWSKDFTHLIGWGALLPGVGQRSRITGSAALDATYLIDVSAHGCIFRNIQVYNGADANQDAGALIVSGDRNEFTNVFAAGMAHTTPGARAGCYSLKLSGQENLFDQCAIGLDTVLRAAANCELWLAAGATRNVFKKSRFLSYSETAGKVLVKVDDGVDRWNEFEDCMFQNFSVNWANSLTNAFNIAAAATHQIILRGACQLVGVTGWSDALTHIYSSAPQSNAGFGVAVNPSA